MTLTDEEIDQIYRTTQTRYECARVIEARVHEELRKQESDRIHIAGLIDPLTRTQHPDNLTMAVAAKLLRDTAPLPTPSQEEALDAKRWRYYADCPQTALMLGTELDPNSEQDWAAECSRLVDASLARPDTEGSGK